MVATETTMMNGVPPGSLQRRSTVTESLSLDTSFASSSTTDCVSGLNHTQDSLKGLVGSKKINNIHFDNNIHDISHDQHINVNYRAIHRPSLRSMHRLVEKDGKCNVVLENGESDNCCRFAGDFFTTVVDMPWRYNFAMVIFGFLISWVAFAGIYYGIAFGRGDFEHINNSSHEHCFRNFKNWRSAFLYSLEAQTTIGFGFRAPLEQCWESIACLVVQVIWANFMEAFIIGAFIAKFSRPKMRANTLIFSQTACISKQDDKMCFMFRIGDLRRKSPIVEGHIRLQMIRHHITKEGCFIPYKIFDMDIGHEIGIDRIFLVWPILVSHVIDSKSPLYDIGKTDLHTADFEIVVILEGIVEATGTTTQARTSYLPSEIQWGYYFDNLVNERKNKHYVDMDKFDWTRPMPEFSDLSVLELEEQEAAKEEAEGGNDESDVWKEQTEENRPSRPNSVVNNNQSNVDMESRL